MFGFLSLRFLDIYLVTMSNSNENSKEQDTLIVQSDVENGGSRCAKLFKTKTSRLASMLTLIGLYFLAEIIVGKF